MLRFHVGGKVVERVDLLRKKHWTWRLDLWPFAILYAAWLAVVVPSIDFGDALIVLGGLVALHVLVLLFTGWSVDFKCFVQYSKVFFYNHYSSSINFVLAFDDSYELPLHLRRWLIIWFPAVCLTVYVQLSSDISLFLLLYLSAGFEAVYSLVRL